jgi:hypothetical protein
MTGRPDRPGVRVADTGRIFGAAVSGPDWRPGLRAGIGGDGLVSFATRHEAVVEAVGELPWLVLREVSREVSREARRKVLAVALVE